MEEHEIIDRLKNGMFSDAARPIAEQVLLQRGVDPKRPIVPADQQLELSNAPRKPRLLPGFFAAIGGILVGPYLGASIAGAVGASLTTGIVVLLGWWIGSKVAIFTHRFNSRPIRLAYCAVAVLSWLVVMGLIGAVLKLGRA